MSRRQAALRARAFPAAERAFRNTRRWIAVAGIVAIWNTFCLIHWPHTHGFILVVRLATLALEVPFFVASIRSALRLHRVNRAFGRTTEYLRGQRRQPNWRLQ